MNYFNINMINCFFLNISFEFKKYYIKYKKKEYLQWFGYSL